MFIVAALFFAVPVLPNRQILRSFPLDRELVIGTKEAPPFAMKAADGAWQGISIDLWRRIADEKNGAIGLSKCKPFPD